MKAITVTLGVIGDQRLFVCARQRNSYRTVGDQGGAAYRAVIDRTNPQHKIFTSNMDGYASARLGWRGLSHASSKH